MVKIKPKQKTKKTKTNKTNINTKNVKSKTKTKMHTNKKLIRLRKRFNSRHLYKNPQINYFNLDSNFIYDLDEAEKFILNNQNANLLKVNKKELDNLNKIIEDISLKNDSLQKTNFICIKKDVYDVIIDYLNVKEINDPLTLFIKNNLEDEEKRALVSTRKLANLYFEQTGIKTNRTTVNEIIRKKLGYHYLKTCPKNKSIKNKENQIICFAFIKIIIRCLLLGFDIIFLDESILSNKNNHFRCLRKVNEQIYYKYDKLSKLNLLMAVNKDGIIYYEINEESTTQESFLNYMNNLVNKIKENHKENYVIIMDNLSVHKTSKLMEFYKNNKVNVLFNCPYLSEWNCIELAFRALKKQYYKKIFPSVEELKVYVIDILNSDNYAKTLSLNFCETLREYKKFIIENKNTNLNLLRS